MLAPSSTSSPVRGPKRSSPAATTISVNSPTPARRHQAARCVSERLSIRSEVVSSASSGGSGTHDTLDPRTAAGGARARPDVHPEGVVGALTPWARFRESRRRTPCRVYTAWRLLPAEDTGGHEARSIGDRRCFRTSLSPAPLAPFRGPSAARSRPRRSSPPPRRTTSRERAHLARPGGHRQPRDGARHRVPLPLPWHCTGGPRRRQRRPGARRPPLRHHARQRLPGLRRAEHPRGGAPLLPRHTAGWCAPVAVPGAPVAGARRP